MRGRERAPACTKLLAAAAAAMATAMVAPAGALARGAVFGLKLVRHPPGLAYAVFHARAGQTVSDTVIVSNSGDAPGRLRLYPVDATTGRTTGAVYLGHSAPRRDVGAWTSLGVSTVSLGPGQTRSVRFSVRVPLGAAPGQHLGGIVAENLKLTTNRRRHRGASFRISVRNLSIVAVQVDIPGTAVEKLTLTSVGAGPQQGFQTLLIGMRNSGNQLLKGSGQLVVRPASGGNGKSVSFPVDTFVPGTAISDPVGLPGRPLPAGTYDATVVVRYGHGRVARLSRTFTISSAQITEVFGAHPAKAPSGGGSSISPVVLIGGGFAVFAAGAAVSRVRRRPN